MNASDSKWYRKKRLNVEHRCRDATARHDRSETFDSPSGKYRVKVTPYMFHLERDWTYTIGEIYGPDGPISHILRDFSTFPIAWCEEHPDGHDYLICGEDYLGQTVIRLDTGDRVDYIEPQAENREAFCWEQYEVSPDGLSLVVVGYEGPEPASPFEIRFLSFRSPFSLPYHSVGKDYVEYFEELLGWESESRVLISKRVEYRSADGAPLSILKKEKQDEALSTPDGTRYKRVIYSLGLDGSQHEVYSEWLPPDKPRKPKRK